MNLPIRLCSLLLIFSILSCQSNKDKVTEYGPILKEGIWLVTMALPDAELPFKMELALGSDEIVELVVVNDKERISVKDVVVADDSIFIDMPVFQSKLVGKIESDASITGQWYNFAKGNDYHIPFTAAHGVEDRFPIDSTSSQALKNFDGKWEVTFTGDGEDSCKAIGAFRQNGTSISGTFMTETGDYRFLEGNVVGDSMFLSCFDGSHAFLFKASQDNNGEISGRFWSGKHWSENWVGVRNEAFELSHPDSLTFLKEGYDKLSFSFPNLDSVMVSLDDERFDDKAIIVQLMGSWCPNCADETAFLAELYEKYRGEGLEIIALAYERSENFEESVKAIKKVKNHFQANYDFLVAGPANKKEAQKTLPMLNHIMSYPTCIFIDRDKKIRKIHTGFYGPSTGEFYDRHVEETVAFTESLLRGRG